MIDTIWLKTTNFQVKPKNSIVLESYSMPCHDEDNSNLNNNLFKNTMGQTYNGNRAFVKNENNDLLNIQIFNNKKSSFEPMIQIRTSLSRASCPLTDNKKTNYYPIDEEKLKYAFNNIQETLDNVGIILDLKNMRISRIDLFKNIELENPFYCYTPTFNLLECKYKKKIQYSDETWIYQSNYSEIVIYNKLVEMRTKNKIIPKGLSENIARVEVRFKKEKVVKQMLGLEKFSDIFYSLHKFNKIFNQYVKDNLLIDSEDLSMKYISKGENLQNVLANADNVDKVLKCIGCKDLIDNYGYDYIKSGLQTNYSRRYKNEKSAKDHLRRKCKMFLKNSYNAKIEDTKISYYNEFKNKLLGS